jgi:opine dehydrogenase
MKVSILGAGAVAYGTAAYLIEAGHQATLWSPSGHRTKALAAGASLVTTGAIEGRFRPAIASSCIHAIADADAVMVVLPANGHKAVFDAAAPHIRNGLPIIISSHMSFGALYLSRLLIARGVETSLIAWGTTLTTGRQTSTTEVKVNTVRKKIDFATVPQCDSANAMSLCTELFGDRFVERQGLLAIALSNLNPQNHLAIGLTNLTRMEKGERWNQSEYVTPAVGRLMEALDAERLAIARALEVHVRTVQEHFLLSYNVDPGSVSEMNQQMLRNGHGAFGPGTAESRYVLEDVPFGLEATAQLGRMAGVPAPLHEAGISLLSAAYGRDFSRENDLLKALDMGSMSMGQLQALARNGAMARRT